VSKRSVGLLGAFLATAATVDTASACEYCMMARMEWENPAIRGWKLISVVWLIVQTVLCARDLRSMDRMLRRWTVLLWLGGFLLAFTVGRRRWFGYWPFTLCLFPMVFSVLVLILGNAWRVPRRLLVSTLVAGAAAITSYIASRAYAEWLLVSLS
jgi:hypothetical protein